MSEHADRIRDALGLASKCLEDERVPAAFDALYALESELEEARREIEHAKVQADANAKVEAAVWKSQREWRDRAEAAEAKLAETREFISAWAHIEDGVTSFDLHHAAVDRFKRASAAPYVKEIITATLASAQTEDGRDG